MARSPLFRFFSLILALRHFAHGVVFFAPDEIFTKDFQLLYGAFIIALYNIIRKCIEEGKKECLS